MSWHGPPPRHGSRGWLTKSHVVESWRIETGIDGIENSLLGIAEVHRTIFFLWRAESNHSFAGDCRYFAPPFRIGRAHTPTLRKSASCRFSLRSRSHAMTNNRNVLYLIIGMFGGCARRCPATTCIRAKKEPEGVQINVGPNGLKIQSK